MDGDEDWPGAEEVEDIGSDKDKPSEEVEEVGSDKDKPSSKDGPSSSLTTAHRKDCPKLHFSFKATYTRQNITETRISISDH